MSAVLTGLLALMIGAAPLLLEAGHRHAHRHQHDLRSRPTGHPPADPVHASTGAFHPADATTDHAHVALIAAPPAKTTLLGLVAMAAVDLAALTGHEVRVPPVVTARHPPRRREHGPPPPARAPPPA